MEVQSMNWLSVCWAALVVLAFGLGTLATRAETAQSAPSSPDVRSDEVLPPPRNPTDGVVSRTPTLGVRVVPVDPAAIQKHGLVVQQGALVVSIEPDSPSARAGLTVGNVIVALDGRRIDSPTELAQAMRFVQAGQEVELTFYQQNRLVRRRIQMPGPQAPALLSSPPLTDSATVPPASSPQVVERPVSPVPHGTMPVGPQSGFGLERELGGNGSRPLLGRIGRILENVVAPAQAFDYAPPTGGVQAADPWSEISALRQQVEDLQAEVQTLRRQVETLERRLGERQ
jgi:hypothetical protein